MPPERKDIVGSAGGTVSCKTRTVCWPISAGPALGVKSDPERTLRRRTAEGCGIKEIAHGREKKHGRSDETYHVRLQEAAFKDDVVVSQGFEGRGQDTLRDVGAVLDTVPAVHEDLWLHNGHEAILLGDARLPREDICIRLDRQLRRRAALLDMQDTPPFGEASALGIVLGAAIPEAVDALSHSLAVRARQNLHALIDLDSGDDAIFLQDVGEALPGIVRLEQRLLERDAAADIFVEARLRGGGHGIAHVS